MADLHQTIGRPSEDLQQTFGRQLVALWHLCGGPLAELRQTFGIPLADNRDHVLGMPSRTLLLYFGYVLILIRLQPLLSPTVATTVSITITNTTFPPQSCCSCSCSLHAAAAGHAASAAADVARSTVLIYEIKLTIKIAKTLWQAPETHPVLILKLYHPL